MFSISNNIVLSLVSAGSVSLSGRKGRRLESRVSWNLNISIDLFVIDHGEIGREGSGDQETKKDLGFHR